MKKSEHYKNLFEEGKTALEVLYFQRKVVNKCIEDLEDTLTELQIDLMTAEIEEAGNDVTISHLKEKVASYKPSVDKRVVFKFYKV